MSLRHAILGIVEYQPAHGYVIRRVLQEGISTFWPVNLAGIYPSLRRLEEEGLVAHRMEASEEGRPDRKVYEITDAGREEMARWRRLPPEGSVTSKVPLFLKLLFAREENLPDTMDWIAKEVETLRSQASQLRSDLNNPEIFETFFVRFMRETGLAQTELQIELLQDLRSKVARHIEKAPAREGAKD